MKCKYITRNIDKQQRRSQEVKLSIKVGYGAPKYKGLRLPNTIHGQYDRYRKQTMGKQKLEQQGKTYTTGNWCPLNSIVKLYSGVGGGK